MPEGSTEGINASKASFYDSGKHLENSDAQKKEEEKARKEEEEEEKEVEE